MKWTIKEFLSKHNKTPYALMKETGLPRQTIYSITNNQTKGLEFATMARLVAGLEKITGASVTPNDLLEVVRDAS